MDKLEVHSWGFRAYNTEIEDPTDAIETYDLTFEQRQLIDDGAYIEIVDGEIVLTSQEQLAEEAYGDV